MGVTIKVSTVTGLTGLSCCLAHSATGAQARGGAMTGQAPQAGMSLAGGHIRGRGSGGMAAHAQGSR